MPKSIVMFPDFFLMRASSILNQTRIILLVANPIMSTCSLVQSPFLDHQNRSKRLKQIHMYGYNPMFYHHFPLLGVVPMGYTPFSHIHL